VFDQSPRLIPSKKEVMSNQRISQKQKVKKAQKEKKPTKKQRMRFEIARSGIRFAFPLLRTYLESMAGMSLVQKSSLFLHHGLMMPLNMC
jgi:hypothetical protein